MTLNIFLIIISFQGYIERVPMRDEEVCRRAAAVFNEPNIRHAHAYCIRAAS